VPADDLVAGLFLGGLVDHRDGGAELDLGAGQLGDVDDRGAGDQADLDNLAFDPALPILGGVVLSVLLEVAVKARLADGDGDGGPLDRLQPLQAFGSPDLMTPREQAAAQVGVVFTAHAAVFDHSASVRGRCAP
jgi:hypothetical protein